MLDNQINHILEMNQLAKEGIRNLLRSGASMLRIKAQGAREYAEHQRQMEVVEEITSTPDAPDQELDEKLTDARFRAVLLVDSVVLNLVIHQLAAAEGFGNPTGSVDWKPVKEMVKLIREGNIEKISSIIGELTSVQKSYHYLNSLISSSLGEEKFESIKQKAKDIATTYSSDIYA